MLAACGIFLDQGSNPCPLHWQADSLPLRHQGSPAYFSFMALPSPILGAPATWHGPFRTPGTGFPSKFLMFLVPLPDVRLLVGRFQALQISRSRGSAGGSNRESWVKERQAHPGSCLDLALAAPHLPTQGLGPAPVNESVASSPNAPRQPHPAACPRGQGLTRERGHLYSHSSSWGEGVNICT